MRDEPGAGMTDRDQERPPLKPRPRLTPKEELLDSAAATTTTTDSAPSSLVAPAAESSPCPVATPAPTFASVAASRPDRDQPPSILPHEENIDVGEEFPAKCTETTPMDRREEYSVAPDGIPKRSVPNVNIPEKIIFCVDVCDGADGSERMDMICAAIDFFVRIKRTMSPRTEFAAIRLGRAGPVWMADDDAASAFRRTDPEIAEGDSLDLDRIYEVIAKNIDPSEENFDAGFAATGTVRRLILIYGRSECVPTLSNGSEHFDALRERSYFTTDVVYLHDERWDPEARRRTYEALQCLDDGYSYVFEVAKDEIELHRCMAKLSAHPFQRPPQKNSSYELIPKRRSVANRTYDEYVSN